MGNKDSKLKGQMVSGMFWKMAERVVAQGVSFVVSLVLARILMPHDYGVVAIIMVFIAIADVLLSSGLSSGLIQKKEVSELEFSSIFYCNLFLGIILYIILFIAAPFMAHIYKLPALTAAIRVFALRLPISAFQAIQVAYVSRQMAFKRFFFSTVGGTIVSAGVGIIMALQGYGAWALIAQYLTMTIMDTAILFLTIHWHPTMQFSWNAASPIIKYSWKVMATDLSGTIFNNLGNFIVGLRYNTSNLAYYNKGFQLPTMVRSNIYMTLISVLFPAMSKVGDSPSEVNRIVSKSIRVLSYVLFPVMTGLLATAKIVTIILFSDRWVPMTPFMQIACIEAMISVVGTVTLQALKAMGYSDVMLKMEFIKKPIYLASLLCVMPFGVMAIALVFPLNTILELFINGHALYKRTGYSIRNQLIDCVPATLLSLIMSIPVFAISYLSWNIYLIFAIQVICGAGLYILLSILFKVDAFSTVMSVLRNKLGIKPKVYKVENYAPKHKNPCK